MTKWEAYTWLAIGVLVVGSLAVFGWFLRDALRLYRRLADRSARHITPDTSRDSS